MLVRRYSVSLLPARSYKTIMQSWSAESVGAAFFAPLLIGGPRFSGVVQTYFDDSSFCAAVGPDGFATVTGALGRGVATATA